MLESLFNKVVRLNASNFIKKRLQHKFFCEFRTFLKTPFFTEHLRWLLLKSACEGTSFVKMLQFCNFNIFGINRKWRCPLRKIRNNRACWNVYRSSCWIKNIPLVNNELMKLILNLFISLIELKNIHWKNTGVILK